MYYHVWWITKYRKAVLEGELENFVKTTITECIRRHEYKVLELETNRDHLHMLLQAEDRKDLAAIVRILKAVSAKETFLTPHFRVGNNRHLWARRYGYKEILASDIPIVTEYIRNQKQISHTEEQGGS